MTTKFNLGDKVKFNDFLVRAQSIRSSDVLKLAEAWPELPSKILESAKKANDKIENRKASLFSSSYQADTYYNIWVPASVRKLPYDELGFWMNTDDRHHPNPSYTEMQFPLEGFVTQKVQIQDGSLESGDEYSGRYLVMESNTVGYKVAYHLNRRPVLVLPYMIERF